MKEISLITTVYNEEQNIRPFLDSILKQTRLPNEIVIVDAESEDRTIQIIKEFFEESKTKQILRNVTHTIVIKEGNRSIGRNTAIKNTKYELIVCTDVGCTLDVRWIENITNPFFQEKADVVAGYYLPITKNVFEQCLAAYTCVMPDNIDPKEFLPSSRSVAFRKASWEKVGGYSEALDYCEDLVFAKKLKKAGQNFEFARDAIVYWPQRENFKQAFAQFFNYAYGDGYAFYFRRQTPLLFLRVVVGLFLVAYAVSTQNPNLLSFLIILFLIYLVISVRKNFKYVKKKEALLVLPALQIISDIAVFLGTSYGVIRRVLGLRSFSK